jgi:hypothetical protein
MTVLLGWSPRATGFKYQLQVLLILLLLLEHPDVARGELVFIDLVLFHLFNGETIVPLLMRWLK